MIKSVPNKLHWNYLIALEHDLETVSRYVEFAKPNYDVYSIELAHLLFAAASEVDVIAKLLCEILDPSAPRENITHYRNVLVAALPDLTTDKIFVPRYGLTLVPWDNWTNANNANPLWWRSYNRVKHERDTHFAEATLKNALNAMAALLLLNYHYYAYSLCSTLGHRIPPKETTRELQPQSTLLRLPDDYYDDVIIAD
jgi:hypothetical protein